ncbi:MAG: c-type cytochrome [Psychroflexus salarius]
MKVVVIASFLLCLSVLIWKSETSSINYLEQSQLTESIKRGQIVYNNFCMRCHLPDGSGVAGVYPPIANSNWLSEKRTESIKAVKYGLNGEIEVNGEIYNNMMSSMGLSDQEVVDVMNYIMNNFENKQKKPVTLSEVQAIKK